MHLEFGESRLAGEPGQRQLTLADGGERVGVACWSMRDVRDATGHRRRLGFVHDLEVRQAVRRQGYGTRLIELLLTTMRREQCEWVMALPSAEAVEFYARLGWRPVALLECQGRPGSHLSGGPAEYTIRRYDPAREPAGWAPLADIFAADGARWPLAMLRDADYWATHIAECVSGDRQQLRPSGEFFVAAMAETPSDLVGYVLVHWWHLHPQSTCYFEVTELCARPLAHDVERALLAAIGRQAAGLDCRMEWGRLFLPREPRFDRAAEHLLRDPEWSTFVELRARPLSRQAGTTWSGAPGAACWSMDVL